MIWTYRVFCDTSHRYSIREVFYEQDGTIIGYSKSPVAVVGNSPEDITQQITWLREAVELSILSIETTDAQIAAQSQTKTPDTTVSFQDVRALLTRETPHESSAGICADCDDETEQPLVFWDGAIQTRVAFDNE